MAYVLRPVIGRVSDLLTVPAHCRLKFDTLKYRDIAVTGRDTYRRKAMECARAAEGLRDAGERNKLLRIAGLYMSLAHRIAERFERGTAHRQPDPEHYPEDA
jgi:hypothetical protein